MEFADAMLTLEDVQGIFRCGRRQAYELLHIPGFPAMKLGRKYLISAKALEAWIQANTGKTVIK